MQLKREPMPTAAAAATGPATRAAQLALQAALALPAVLATAPAVAQPLPPEQGSLSLKYLDYLDSQPGIDRVRIKAPVLGIVAPFSAFGGPWAVSGTLIHDDISGASPAYHTRAIKKLVDRRDAGDVSLTRYGERSSATLGLSYSTEADYVGRGVSAQLTQSSDDNNRTWSFGVALGRDRINPTNNIVANEHKRRADYLLGLTQVMSRRDIVQVNLGFSRGSGYFSDPYKVFDERPRDKRQHTVSVRWNRHFEGSGATLRSSWRYYDDSFGIRSHTLNFEWAQALPAGVVLTPSLRLYTQSAASFYVDADPSSPFPPNPPDGARYFSEDQRLSAFGGRTLGLKVAKQFGDNFQADFKAERYVQRGSWRWGGGGSPGLAEFRARSYTLGMTWRF